ncbi:glycoside hydrolase family 43 protein [Thermothelomyces thermophilus ATCC 42464]|uniref:Glycoside hydrolase family 43 protein n=2 Tax=leotiomyceta TaxID=716546 RepID=G2QCC8_THET4|nr:glycoside hydrolase family 43 protein [Thermothelomyces thermophilus ATCC 42464]AEO57303.1 glycoside hydrolase family 43 protein [Thermothelomyces thermophilus ATCC 42464]
MMGRLNDLIALLALLSGSATSAAVRNTASQARAAEFNNPVLWEDYPDLDVFRVGSTFYYSSSTFAYSPGAPVLKSYDLVNWTPVTHSVPTLNFGDRYNLTGGTPAGYVKGIWASTLRYRPSNDKFYWYGCVEFGKTYIWTSSGTRAGDRDGEVDPADWVWEPHPPIDRCYYDSGLLIDDDDKMYIAYGNPKIEVAELSDDGLTEVSSRVVYTPPAGTTIEGSRMYKVGDAYYILVTRPADAEWVLRSTSGPFGPYEQRELVSRINGPLSNAGFAHQGGMVDTPDGRSWYYVAFMDAYPGGRIPVVAPLRWTDDGWPEVVTDAQGGWGASYPVPVETGKTVPDDGWELDEFRGGRLSHHWEWNHNPDPARFALAGGDEGGLVLQAATVTEDLFAARNTLTRRIRGPKSSGTFRLDVSRMRDGDRAGAVLFRDTAAYIGVWKQGDEATIVVVDGLELALSSWTTVSTGRVAETGPTLSSTQDVWLRIEADITPAFGTNTARTTTFSYSVDGGKTFVRLGPAFSMSNTWQYFTGYRFGVFNFATKELGGEVKVKSFQMQPL